MRVLLALLAVALILIFPLSALGDSVDYQGAGSLSLGTAQQFGSIRAGHVWEVGVQLIEIDDLTTRQVSSGNLGTLDVTSGSLSACSAGFCFTGGTLDIDDSHGHDIFLGKLVSGTISQTGGKTIMSAFLSNGSTAVLKDNASTFSSQALITTPRVGVPEPASSLLLGTGLVILSGLCRKFSPR